MLEGGVGLRRHLSFANVVATIALFVALGGGAYALQKNSIGSKEIATSAVKSKEIKDGSVKGKDVKGDTLTAAQIANGAIGGGELADGAVGAAEIADGAVGGAEVGDNSITGQDVDESSLSGVPPSGTAGGDLQGIYPNPSLDEDSVGADELATPPHIKVFGSGNDLPSGNVVQLGLGSTAVTSSGVTLSAANDDVTINVPGLYVLTAFICWEPNATGRRVVQIERNDLLMIEDSRPASPDARTSQSITTLQELSPGDVINMNGQQTSGGPLDTGPTGAPNPELNIIWVGPGS